MTELRIRRGNSLESQCSGKQGFERHEDASAALRNNLRSKQCKRLGIYRCQFCRMFHLGTPTMKKR